MKLLGTGATKEIAIDPYDWPRCAMCDMPVEQFRGTDTGDSITFVAVCHGKQETAIIPDKLWDTMIGDHVDFGQAFETQEKDNGTTTLDR